MEKERDLQNIFFKKTVLSKLSTVLYVIGFIAIIVGIITLVIGIERSDSCIVEKRLSGMSCISTGIGSTISGFCLFFFGAIGKAVNEIRNYTIADFNLKHGLNPFEKMSSPNVGNNQNRVENIRSKKGVSEDVKAEDLNKVEIGDTVKLLSNGNLFKVIGFVNDNCIQCKSANPDFVEKMFDKYYEFELNQIEKI